MRQSPARVLLVILLFSAGPVGAAESWSTSDVEAAARYREEERERAVRYRAELESAPREAKTRSARKPGPAPGAEAPLGDRLAARFTSWLRAWVGAWLADLVEAAEGWLVAQLEALEQVFEATPPARNELRRAPAKPDPLADWIAREEERARRVLEGLERGASHADPAFEREWERREAERARERARREAREPRRGRGHAPWEERWQDVESWDAIERERERVLRQLESAREWQAEERARLEGR